MGEPKSNCFTNSVWCLKFPTRCQYCPVNLRGIGEKANSGAAFRMTKGVSDLNQK
jgi:hypothetical protein